MTSRHSSPSATAGPNSAPSRYSDVPPPEPTPNWPLPRNAMTQAMMRKTVTRGSLRVEASERVFVFWREHSGQRMPTGVGVMQSGQIGRPQLEQRTPVSRDGWR